VPGMLMSMLDSVVGGWRMGVPLLFDIMQPFTRRRFA
jgi:hypothetical protein